MTDGKAQAVDIAYMAGFADAWQTVRYLTVKLYLAYGTIMLLVSVIIWLAIRRLQCSSSITP